MAKSNRKNAAVVTAVAEAIETPEATPVVAEVVKVPEYNFPNKKALRARVRTLVRAARATKDLTATAIVNTKAGSFQLQLVLPSAEAKYDDVEYVIDGVPHAKRDAYAALMGEPFPSIAKAKKAEKAPAKEADQDEEDIEVSEEDEEEDADE